MNGWVNSRRGTRFELSGMTLRSIGSDSLPPTATRSLYRKWEIRQIARHQGTQQAVASAAKLRELEIAPEELCRGSGWFSGFGHTRRNLLE